MANITFSNLDGDLRLSQMISSEIALLLKDNASLRNSGLLKYAGSINGMGSDTIRVRKVGYGYDSFTKPTLEDDTVAATALTDGHADCVVSRFQLAYKMSDLAGITSFGNSPYEIDPFNLAASIAMSYDRLFAELTAAAALGSTGSVGTSGATFSVSTFFAAIYNLEQAQNPEGIAAGASGQFYSVLHPKALSELQASLRSEQGSVIAQMVATEEMIQAKGQGYAGKLFGVDVYRSGHIETDSTDYNNFMADAGGLMYADGVPSIVGAAETMQMDKVTIEMSRVPEKALSVITGHAYLGLAVLDDARIVKMLSVD